MKIFLLAIFSAVGIVILTVVTWHYLSQPRPTAIISQGPTVERLQRLAHLVTMRIYIADVLVGEGEGCRGSWLIKGDALIGIDLSQARIFDKDDQARKAVLRLPQPEVLQCRVDHEKTRTWEVRRTAWVPWNADADKLRDNVMREAQKLVADAAASGEYVGQAKAAAETMLCAFYREVGWQVQVTWASRTAAASKTKESQGKSVLPALNE